MAGLVRYFTFRKDLGLDIRADPAASNKWLAKCKFTIDIGFVNKMPGLLDLEYRQYIKGRTSQMSGIWAGGIWTPTGAWQSMNLNFPIPPDPKTGLGYGLYPQWKEDGLLLRGVTSRYGYRGHNTVDGSEVIGRYHPDPVMGDGYYAYDVPRLGGEMVEGSHLEIELHFVGAIINVKTGASIEMKQWSFHALRTVRGGALV
jgi:hypothetical protein